MTNTSRRTGFAQKTKLSRFVTEIFFADDFQGHRTSQIDIERFVSDAHRTATQLDRFTVFALASHNAQTVASGLRGRTTAKSRRTRPHQQQPCEACRPDRIPFLQKTRYRNSGKCVCALCSSTNRHSDTMSASPRMDFLLDLRGPDTVRQTPLAQGGAFPGRIGSFANTGVSALRNKFLKLSNPAAFVTGENPDIRS